METKEQKLTIKKLRDYFDEWLGETMSMGLSSDEKDKFNFVIVETSNQNVIYSCSFNNNEYFGENDTICSTSGIVNQEFRGVIEKCIVLDNQIDEKKLKTNNVSKQKGN